MDVEESLPRQMCMDKFIAFLTSHGLVAPAPVVNGKIQRCHTINNTTKKNGWYVAHRYKDHIYGTCGDWATGSQEKYSNGGKVDKAALDLWKAQSALIENEREILQEVAAKEASSYCRKLEPADKHPYIEKKCIKPYGAKQDGSLLVLPMIDAKGNITSYQTIDCDGNKRFLAGGKKKGCFLAIKGDKDLSYLCEGWATACTIHEATGATVIVAFDAGNLQPVHEVVVKRYPHIVIAADNDHRTEGNPGLTKAENIGCKIVYPKNIEGTDFNDLAAEHGIDKCREVLLGLTLDVEIPKIEPPSKGISVKEIMGKTYKPMVWVVPDVIPEGLTIIAARPKFGKSFLSLCLSYAVSTGTTALNFAPAEKRDVIYFALEDSERRVQSRILSMEGYFDTYPENLMIYTDAPRIGSGFTEMCDSLITENPKLGLIIVDTLAMIRPPSSGSRNLYQAEYEDFHKVQKLAIMKSVGIVCIHHTRKESHAKSTGDKIDEMSGSTGLQGVADTLIMCERDGPKGSMYVRGREVKEETYEMKFNMGNLTWELARTNSNSLDIGPLMLDEFFKTHQSISVKDAADLYRTNQQMARRKLDKLVEEEKMRVEFDAKGRKYYFPTKIF